MAEKGFEIKVNEVNIFKLSFIFSPFRTPGKKIINIICLICLSFDFDFWGRINNIKDQIENFIFLCSLLFMRMIMRYKYYIFK